MRGGDYIPDPALMGEARRMLEVEFPTMSDIDVEDRASDAYAELLALARSGRELRFPGQLIRQIARRDQLDRVKAGRSQVFRATPLDPESLQFHDIEDLSPELLSALEDASTCARLEAIAASLTKRQQAVFKCRFALRMSAVEAAAACGLSRSTVKREWKTALEAVKEALSGYEGEVFSRVQLQAVHAYVFAFGELAEGDPKRRLVEDDPATYQLMVEARAAIRAQAASIDLPSTVAGLGIMGGGLSLAALWAALRGHGLGGSAAETGSAAAGGGAASSGGVMAAFGGAKTLAACGGAAVLCGGGALVIAGRDKSHQPEPPAQVRADHTPDRVRPAVPPPGGLVEETLSETESANGANTGGSTEVPGLSSNGSGESGEQPPAGAAAVAAEEFDPLAAPVAPAAAPATPSVGSESSGSPSGDSGSSGDGSGQAAGAEFGP